MLLNDQDPYLIEIVSDDPVYEGKLYKVKWYSGTKVWSKGEWVTLTMFFGNGYTNSELAVEYALRRCAELTAQNGYRYFGILAVNDFSAQSSFTIPGSAYTTGNLNVNQFGNTAFGTYTSRTFITPAQTV
jgi:hypothetical protein